MSLAHLDKGKSELIFYVRVPRCSSAAIRMWLSELKHQFSAYGSHTFKIQNGVHLMMESISLIIEENASISLLPV